MSFDMINAFKTIQATPTQRLVAYMLADACNSETQECYPSVATLMRLTGLSDRAIETAIKHLETAGHLRVLRRRGLCNSYRLHPRPATATGEPPSPPPPNQDRSSSEPPSPPPPAAATPPANLLPPTPETPSPPPPNDLPQTSEPGSPKPEEPEIVTGSNQDPARTLSFRYPTLDEVKALAEIVMAPPECAETFWNDNEAIGWVNKNNIPIHDWRPAFRSYATRWKSNSASPFTHAHANPHPRHPPARSDSCNLPGRYAAPVGNRSPRPDRPCIPVAL